jgi:ATP-dependent helicase HrpA
VPLSRRALERRLTNEARLALGSRSGIGAGELLDDCTIAAADRVIALHGELPWDEDAFGALRDRGRAELADLAGDAVAAAGRIVALAAAVEARLVRLTAAPLQPAVADVRAQLGRLVRRGFVTTAGIGRLGDLERYVRAADRRLEKLAADVGRDRQRTAEINALEDRYRRLVERLPPARVTTDVAEAGWLIEELRVGTFAQVLGTRVPVSATRVSRELQRLESEA